MIVYLDSSIVLRPLLSQGKSLKEWGNWQAAYSSEILALEVRRVIDRLRLEGALNDRAVAQAQHGLTQIERTIRFIYITRMVLRRAAMPMATVVKSLDAIHIASALLFQERRREALLFATHDVQQAVAARAMGFEVTGA